MKDTLTIGYDRSEQNDIPILTVARVRAGRVCVLKSVYGEEAERIYNGLTEQETKYSGLPSKCRRPSPIGTEPCPSPKWMNLKRKGNNYDQTDFR